MDERTLEAAQAYNERLTAAGCAKHGKSREHTIVVLGRDGNRPFTLTATSRQACIDQLAQRGINVLTNKWGAGYRFGEDVSTYGNDDLAKHLVERHLRR